MKKRILALLLTLVTAASLCSVPAAAFSDVKETDTGMAVESLRLMGVLDGYGDGTFRPDTELNRAQFCKMAVYAMDGSGEVGKYSTVTVFPDVKPSHWAATYINMAAKGAGIISGYPDGKFHPERTVTAGQAVTILLRLLGYSDADIGGIWPASQMAFARSVGLTDGTGVSDGNRPLTRAQAAKLFCNFLSAETKSGSAYYTLSEETTLLALDGGTGTMKVADGKVYTMARSVASSDLVGSRGKVVLNSKGKAMTFLPLFGGVGGVSGAVIISADGSVAELNALTGGSSYTIYKNGLQAHAQDLRKNDVAVWNAADGIVRVCDTRVTVYYENCAPSPAAAATIEVLGGTVLQVLPEARDALAKFKPGKVMTLLLTPDGQVASAVEANAAARSNAVAIVSAAGKVQLLCGTTLLDLKITAGEKYYGQAVRISSSRKDEVSMSVLQSGVSHDLDVAARKLGSKALTDNVMVYRNGEAVSLQAVGGQTVRKDEILYARTNWAGEVDLLVLDSPEDDMIYGLAEVSTSTDEEGEVIKLTRVRYGNGLATEAFDDGRVSSGSFVAAKLNRSATGFSVLRKMACLKNVSESSWIGKNAVNFAGKTYVVPETVLCYNLDARVWITLDAALAYTDVMDIYVDEGAVRIVTVKS